MPKYINREFIVCAAIHVNAIGTFEDQPKGIVSGYVVTGRRHSDCYIIIESVLRTIGQEGNYEYIESLAMRTNQGFITSLNRFVTRDIAFKIAKGQDQIRHKLHDNLSEGILTSEDLY